MPAVEAVAPQRRAWRRSSLLAPAPLERHDPRQPQRLIRMRQRVLTLPVMVAMVISLVWRRMPAVAEGQKVLAREGLLGIPPLPVSPQAITNRLDVLPAAVMGQLCAAVCTRWQAQAAPAVCHPSWAPVWEHFPVMAMVEGSTLEALRKRTQVLQARDGVMLAGKPLVMGEAFSHRPLWQRSTEAAAANDQRCAAEILAALPVGGLVVLDRGCFSVLWFDDCTGSQTFFVTRMREKTAYRTVQVLRQSPYYRDELLQVGQDRSNPCTYPLRMVSVRWQDVWSRYRTHVLDPQVLSARQVWERSRRRWRLAEACAWTTRLLEVAYVGTGAMHAVPWPRSATLVCSAVLVLSCPQLAQALGDPVDRLAVEMVCRAASHDRRAVPRGAWDNLVTVLVEHATLLSLVKQHRERQQLESIIGGDP